MGHAWGSLAAMLSSALGGTSIGATRYLAGEADPLTIGAFRFGIGCACLLPVALLGGGRWPGRADWPGVAGLGLLFFALFPVLFNASLIFTTAARGALALSTLPLLTMAAAALLGAEKLSGRKTLGVLIAVAGVAVALVAGLDAAPEGAWRGDLLMVAAAGCMALYNVWSRPLIRRSGPIPFTVAAMAVGAPCLALVAWAQGGLAAVPTFGAPQWLALVYLGVVGGAATFFLWALALQWTTPTRVAVSVTLNPIAAGLFGAALLAEPVGWDLIAGLVGVLLGIAIAVTGREAERDAAFTPTDR